MPHMIRPRTGMAHQIPQLYLAVPRRTNTSWPRRPRGRVARAAGMRFHQGMPRAATRESFMTRLIEFLQESASLGLWSLGAVILVPAIVVFLILHLLVRRLEGEGQGEAPSMRRLLRHYAR